MGARPGVRGWGKAAARRCRAERASPIRTRRTPWIRVESAAVRRVEPTKGGGGCGLSHPRARHPRPCASVSARPCGSTTKQPAAPASQSRTDPAPPPARRQPAFCLSGRACRSGPIRRYGRVEATRTARQRSQSALNGSSAPGPAGASQVHAFSAAAAPCSAACNPCRPGSSGPCCWDCVMIGTG